MHHLALIFLHNCKHCIEVWNSPGKCNSLFIVVVDFSMLFIFAFSKSLICIFFYFFSGPPLWNQHYAVQMTKVLINSIPCSCLSPPVPSSCSLLPLAAFHVRSWIYSCTSAMKVIPKDVLDPALIQPSYR